MENKNDMEVFIMPNLIEAMNKIINLDTSNIESVDEALWYFTHNQLQFLKNFSTEEAKKILNDFNIKLTDLCYPEMLKKMLAEKLAKLYEENDYEDLKNKELTMIIQLDYQNDFDRVIEFKFNDIPQSMIESDEEDLPHLNDLIKAEIESVCNESLGDILDEEELQTFINERIEDYEESPYTTDWLDGFIEGYLNNKEGGNK